MPTIRQVKQLTQHGSYTFSIDLNDAFLLLSITITFYILFSNTNLISVMFLSFGLAEVPMVYTTLTKYIVMTNAKGSKHKG